MRRSRGDMVGGARDRCADCSPCTGTLFIEANPIPVKWAVARMGLMGNAIRLPLVELSPAHHESGAARDAGGGRDT